MFSKSYIEIDDTYAFHDKISPVANSGSFVRSRSLPVTNENRFLHNGNFTVEFLINVEAAGSGGGNFLLTRFLNNRYFRIGVTGNGNFLRANWFRGSNKQLLGFHTQGTNQHVIVTVNQGVEFSIFTDSVKNATAVDVTIDGAELGAERHEINSTFDNNTRGINGWMRDLRIYNTNISDADAATIYNGGTYLPTDQLPSGLAGNVISEVRFNQRNGVEAIDSSPFGNNIIMFDNEDTKKSCIKGGNTWKTM